jgi:hypothetical protein
MMKYFAGEPSIPFRIFGRRTIRAGYWELAENLENERTCL